MSPATRAWLVAHLDDTLLRWLFRGVLLVTAGVLAADLASANGWLSPGESSDPPGFEQPGGPELSLPAILPSLVKERDPRLAPLPRPDGSLGKPMTFELVSGGRLMAVGTITPGISEGFAAAVAKYGDYIKTVVLHSPGGSVSDAMAMGKLIRDKKLATEVEAGKYCASSCPLMFMGGVERRAGDKAAIGVHQVFAAKTREASAIGRDEMSDAQRISARCQRYLGEMGVSLDVWVHAMETPKDRLFVFSADELKKYNVVTTAAPAAAPQTPPSPAKAAKG